MIRHTRMPAAEDWNAIITVAAEYHSREQVKIRRRPDRSAVPRFCR